MQNPLEAKYLPSRFFPLDLVYKTVTMIMTLMVIVVSSEMIAMMNEKSQSFVLAH